MIYLVQKNSEDINMSNPSGNRINHDLDYINILHDEWKFRLSQYWSLTSKTV